MSAERPLSDEDKAAVENLGRALTQAVNDRHASHVLVAKEAGISRQSLYRMMSGKGRPPQMYVLIRIARSLGVKPGLLLEGEVVRDPNAPPPAEASTTALAADVRSVRARQAHFVTKTEFHDELAKVGTLLERLAQRVDAVERKPAPRPRARASAKKA